MKRIYVLLCGLLIAYANPNELYAHERFHHLPVEVINSMDHHYGNFDLIHSEVFYRRGQLRFNLVIQHRLNYVTVTLGAHGNVLNQSRYHRYPLEDHYCQDQCRFHFQHYHGNGFISYDPHSGCRDHYAFNNKYQGHLQVSFFGHGELYYHPEFQHYKRLKNRRNGYHLYGANDHYREGRSYGKNKHHHKHQNKHRVGYNKFNYSEGRHNSTSKYSQGHKDHTGRQKDHRKAASQKRHKRMHYVDPSRTYSRLNRH